MMHRLLPVMQQLHRRMLLQLLQTQQLLLRLLPMLLLLRHQLLQKHQSRNWLVTGRRNVARCSQRGAAACRLHPLNPMLIPDHLLCTVSARKSL
jgi:hypothetical protein